MALTPEPKAFGQLTAIFMFCRRGYGRGNSAAFNTTVPRLFSLTLEIQNGYRSS